MIAISLLALGACGGERATSGTAPATADVEVRAVDGIAWNAKAYTATATDGNITLYAGNDSTLPHSLQVLDKDGKKVGKLVDLSSPGTSKTVEIALTPGSYRIVCEVAGHTNMNSTLTVS
jgi:uncharacterized cupredoxin-like copper-binding protein